MSKVAPGSLEVIAGYIAAVAVASVTASAAIADTASLSNFMSIVMVAGIYIGTAGLPGFALVVYLARQRDWNGWLTFVVLGAGNVLVAWLLLSALTGMAADSELLMASLRGGIAGGVAYWWVAYHAFRKPAAA